MLTERAAEAIRAGRLDVLEGLLKESPGLANERIGPRTLLHIATDWPGHFPNNPETVALLIAHGADVNARFSGPQTETPLHWAASCNDVDVLDALLDHGADIEARGAVIGGGTPLADAVAFGQWNAARRLIERGANATLWQASALGLMNRIEAFFRDGAPHPDEITNAFWCACHGGQRGAAEYLLNKGADPIWAGHDKLTPLQAAQRSNATEVVEWLQKTSLPR
jgi:ankyrin repeat protein